MSTDLVPAGTSPFEAIRHEDERGEHWLGREVQPLMGYTNWRQFTVAVERAMFACSNSGAPRDQHFEATLNINDLGYKSQDYRLTRYAAYLVALNGDPRKSEVAAAQTYFAVKTREAETREPEHAPVTIEVSLDDYERLLVGGQQLLARLRAQQQELNETHAYVTEIEPSANSWNVLASADGDFSVREAANILNRDHRIDTGQRRLFALLREWKIIDSRNMPYGSHAPHARLRARSYTDQQTGEQVPVDPQVRITAAGLRYLHRRMTTTPALPRGEGGQPGLFSPENVTRLPAPRRGTDSPGGVA